MLIAIISILVILCVIFLAVIVRAARRFSGSWKGISIPTAGEVGEHSVTRRLRRLDDEKYFIINDLLFRKQNGLTTQIDHVVVSPYGVFVIETKNISGYIYGREKGQKWKRIWKAWWYGFEHSNQLEFDNPILQNEAHIIALSERLGQGRQIPYYSIIAFSPEAELKVEVEHVPVVYWNHINEVIRSYETPVLSLDEAGTIYGEIKDLNITDPEARKKHAQYANARKLNYEHRTQEAINGGKCPKCGGNLVRRTGQYGAFYGCSNYPNCKYTKHIE